MRPIISANSNLKTLNCNFIRLSIHVGQNSSCHRKSVKLQNSVIAMMVTFIECKVRVLFVTTFKTLKYYLNRRITPLT